MNGQRRRKAKAKHERVEALRLAREEKERQSAAAREESERRQDEEAAALVEGVKAQFDAGKALIQVPGHPGAEMSREFAAMMYGFELPPCPDAPPAGEPCPHCIGNPPRRESETDGDDYCATFGNGVHLGPITDCGHCVGCCEHIPQTCNEVDHGDGDDAEM